MKATGIVRRTMRIREGEPSHTTLTPFDKFYWAIHRVVNRWKRYPLFICSLHDILLFEVNAMKPICYYRELNDDETLPSIKDNISSIPVPNKQKILQYLKSFEPHAVAPGSSTDIFSNEKINSSLSCYNDGTYAWISDEIYYFEKYNLKLDDEFLIFVDNTDLLQILKERLKAKHNKQ